MTQKIESYWSIVWKQFKQHRFGYLSLLFILFLSLIALYAPLFASSQPLVVRWRGEWYFPLFRYLFYTGFYTKKIDLFYNILMLTLPLGVLIWRYPRKRRTGIATLLLIQLSLFLFFGWYYIKDPAADPALNRERHSELNTMRESQTTPLLAPIETAPSWEFDLKYKNHYAQLEEVIRYQLRQKQNKRLQQYRSDFADAALDRWIVSAVVKERQKLLQEGLAYDQMPTSAVLRAQILETMKTEQKDAVTQLPTLWYLEQENIKEEMARNQATMKQVQSRYPEAKTIFNAVLNACNEKQGEISTFLDPEFQSLAEHCDPSQLSPEVQRRLSKYRQIIETYEVAEAENAYQIARVQWLNREAQRLDFMVMPLLRHFHWEDDAGGEQNLNRFLPWYERTRTNSKDLVAALLFGIRISLVVGLLAVGLAMLIGIPVGALAGYYGGKLDIVVSRMLEVWESMPTFFMLLLVVAMTQSKSIFLVIGVIGFFGWTGFARYMRGEVFKQRNLSYVEASQAVGLTDKRIIFSHILPNAIPPILTLLPFAIMGAITSEAGLSFLGLGEEGSCSWGVLMDEGRQAFPGESYLLWPPATMLTLLLVAIALVGDALRDSLDPKLRQN